MCQIAVKEESFKAINFVVQECCLSSISREKQVISLPSPWLGRSRIRRQLVITVKLGEMNLMYSGFSLYLYS